MTHVKVAVRVRPLSQREIELQSASAVSVQNGNTIAVTNLKIPEQNAGDSRERVRRFTFDFCFEENSTQDDVFKAVEKVIGNAVRKRYHSCVLAYGQSSTGKTHTMMGVPDDPGITPKLCQNIFDYLQQSACDDELENMKTRVSYLEIYNEKVRDLLVTPDNKSPSQTLKIREHPKKGPYVQGLTEHSVFESRSLLEWLQVGNNNRRVAATTTNPHSSRSHSVFTVTCYEGVKLHLVDLAGSERAGSRCNSTSRFREGANINKSLVALGNVISALADKTTKYVQYSRKKFIPYRDSVLTWLLKDTLGGNSKTIMIATVSPSSTCYNETVNTLRFGQRAKLIISQPVVNEDPKDRTIRELRIEIARLKELLLTQQLPQDDLQTPPVEENTDIENTSSEDVIDSKSNILNKAEKLIPIMSFNTSVNEKSKKAPPLQRTYSVDAKSNLQGSHEVLPGTSSSTTPKLDKSKRPISSTELRKRSVDKPNLSLRNLLVKKAFEAVPKKIEKGVLTDVKGPKIEAKVDSIRRQSIKPRSQIVAAVTHRLYSKVKKKEASTETDGTNTETEEVPKELQICSNARMKLQELTRQALKAHRRKNEETQTDLFPVLRVKEMSTDVDDLRVALVEVKDAETDISRIETKDVSVSCAFLENLDISDVLTPHNFKSAFTVTRTCGTQSCNEESKENVRPEMNHPNPISFTKYLQNPAEPRFEIINTCTANPIYTTSVNINVSHNYINSTRPSDNVSEDSLDEQNQQNVCFPTPDLISNHNSLEPHTHTVSTNESDLNSASSTSTENTIRINLEEKVRYASSNLIADSLTGSQNFNSFLPTELCVANCINTPTCEERLNSIYTPKVFAAEICIVKEYAEDHCSPFISNYPDAERATRVEGKNETFNRCDVKEPIILKSIMKHNPENEEPRPSLENHSESSDDSVGFNTELPDSLNYHKANSRRVHFTNKPKNNRMMDAMSNFLEEAANLMTNLNIAASQIETSRTSPLPENYELQMTINDVTGLPKKCCKSKRTFKSRRRYSTEPSTQIASPSMEDTSVQTSPKRTTEVSANTDNFEMPPNKYEALVEESCRKLEERINSIIPNPSNENRPERRNSFDSDFLHRFPQPFEINPAWIREPEEDSLESTPTFSDYGSLPRRNRYVRPRTSSCSPSAFLRQLTNMRQQIIESSREELNNEVNMHL